MIFCGCDVGGLFVGDIILLIFVLFSRFLLKSVGAGRCILRLCTFYVELHMTYVGK